MKRLSFTMPAFAGCVFAMILLPGCDESNRNNHLGESVLRVTSTIQYPDFHRPWLKKQPFSRVGLGTILEGGRILVTADLVAHATYIGLERAKDGPKGIAVVEAIDEECNLAVLRPVDRTLLDKTRPLKLDLTSRSGSHLEILQLEANGAPALSPAIITTIAVLPYPADDAAYLLYRASTTIPEREGSFVIPALHDGKLAGLVMRYDSRTQAADIIPAPLISRFLKESSKPGFHGLARAGLGWQEVRGTSLTEWLGVPKGRAGVYVTSVVPGGAAEKGGIKKGDFLLSINGKQIDGEGNYLDPALGKITFNNLSSVESSPGDALAINYFRSSGEGTGTLGNTTLTLGGRNPESETSPLRFSEKPPSYTLLGPLLFLELSRPFLREWGANWRTEAPLDLVSLDAFQDELPKDRKRWVILAAALPTTETMGMENLAGKVVESINGRPIRELSDIAEAAKHPDKGFQKIILAGSAGPIYLDASALPSQEAEARSRYGIPPASRQ
jgi:hypothetical protein